MPRLARSALDIWMLSLLAPPGTVNTAPSLSLIAHTSKQVVSVKELETVPHMRKLLLDLVLAILLEQTIHHLTVLSLKEVILINFWTRWLTVRLDNKVQS